MKINLLLLVLVVFAWSCSSKYEKSSESSDYAGTEAFDEQEAPASYNATVQEEKLSEELIDQSSVKTKKDYLANTDKIEQEKSFTLKQGLQNLSDTLYLKNVRLSKKFIKTADLRFKTEKVENTTKKIEYLALKLGGYIQQSQTTSNYVSSRRIEKSRDTVMEVKEYQVNNNMIIRVPSFYFDSVLTEIGKMHIYLDHRTVNTEDVSTTFLRNKLKEEKRTEYEKRIQKAVDKAPRRLDDIVMAERQASELADIAIDKKIDNYQLQDRIDFSTISLDFYQANTIFTEHVKNTRLTDYQPSFWRKAWKAIQVGWEVILQVIIGLLYLWPLYILAVLIYYGIKYFRKKWKNRK